MYKKHKSGEKASITPERIHVMELMGFEWYPERSGGPNGDTTSQRWQEKFGELKAYIELHGNCKLPSGSPLAMWCGTQRREYRQWKRGEKSLMTKTQFEALQSINFDFCPNETTWNLRIEQLKDYKKEHGDCLVRWMKTLLSFIFE